MPDGIHDIDIFFDVVLLAKNRSSSTPSQANQDGRVFGLNLQNPTARQPTDVLHVLCDGLSTQWEVLGGKIPKVPQTSVLLWI